MTNRSATALLSPVELTALCRIADGGTTDLKPDHLQLLFATGLAALDKIGAATLIVDGQQRLRASQPEQITK